MWPYSCNAGDSLITSNPGGVSPLSPTLSHSYPMIGPSKSPCSTPVPSYTQWPGLVTLNGKPSKCDQPAHFKPRSSFSGRANGCEEKSLVVSGALSCGSSEASL